jgi:hypothetical protein
MNRVARRRFRLDPTDLLLPEQSRECFADKLRRLKGVIAAFPPKIGAGAAPELAIDKGHQIVARL